MTSYFSVQTKVTKVIYYDIIIHWHYRIYKFSNVGNFISWELDIVADVGFAWLRLVVNYSYTLQIIFPSSRYLRKRKKEFMLVPPPTMGPNWRKCANASNTFPSVNKTSGWYFHIMLTICCAYIILWNYEIKNIPELGIWSII